MSLKERISFFNNEAYWLKKGVLYHRGKHSRDIKENTLKAFEGAILDNLGIELDVRLSKDEKVVVIHDNNLSRVYGVDKLVGECTYEEIKDISKGDVPLFTDVLKLVDGRVGLMVEIKSNKVGKLEEKVYELLSDYKGKYVIVSFNPFSLKYFKKKDKNIIRGQLSCDYSDSKKYNWFVRLLLKKLMFNFISCPHFISYGIDGCDYNFLKSVRSKGYFIIGWTYKSEEKYDKLCEVYDNMIIENINLREFKK